MDKKLFHGADDGGGGPSNTPDNLFSEDVVEFALAISEGPIRGLSEGAKTFLVGNTPLLGVDGTRNFEKFAIGVHPGYPEGAASPIQFQLGGVSSNSSVGVSLLKGVPVTRQTDPVLRGVIDELEVRLQFARLLTASDSGTANAKARFKLEYKTTTESTWHPFFGMAVSPVSNTSVTYFNGSFVDGGNPFGDTLGSILVSVGASVQMGDVVAQSSLGYLVLASASGIVASIDASIGDLLAPDTLTQILTINTVTTTGDNGNGELAVEGKTTGGYVREFRTPVPRTTTADWMIRVTKLSDDNNNPDVDTGIFVDMSWDSYQATTKTNPTYPNTAVVHGIGVATGQFSSLPDLAGIYDGLLVRVPTNYNVDLHTYDESVPWNGTFKFAWTDNPAWILYDLIVNSRYGLAAYRPYVDANRFDFYLAAKWCDQEVEPGQRRYSFNMWIGDLRPGLDMLAYVAGSFNALIWDDLNGQIHLKVDKDDPAVMMFTPENVKDGLFNYNFTDINSRANDVTVSFINPDLDWNEDRRRVPNVTTNEDSIVQNGRIPLDFIAVGCTNAPEAIRKAKVRLISAQTETTMVSFITVRPGALLSLYDVILVADPNMGWSQSGRLTSYDSNFLNFRDPIYIETMGTYVVKIQTPHGVQEVNVTPESTGHVTRLALQSALPADIPKHTVFTIEGVASAFGFAKPFRVLSISEVDGSPYLYSINAIEINRNKYVHADGDTDLTEFDYSYKEPSLPGLPYGLLAESGDEQLLVTETGQVISRIKFSYRKPLAAVVSSFEIQWRNALDSEWKNEATTKEFIYLLPVVDGQKYTMRVRAVNGNGTKSRWATIENYTAIGKKVVPNNVVSFTGVGDLFQNKLTWEYGPAPDSRKVEIWGGTTNVLASATKLADLAYPTSSWTHAGLDLGVTIYYTIRVQDTSGNYSTYWTPLLGVTTVSEPSRILAALQGSITETELYTDLLTRINLIDAGDDTPGSVSARIAAEAAARETAIDHLQQVMEEADSALAFDLEWISAVQDTTMAAVQRYSSAAITYGESSLATAITALVAQTADNLATALERYYTKTDTDSAVSALDILLTSRINDVESQVVAVEISASATASDVTGLSAQYTVKLNAGGYVAGFGIALTSPTAGVATSEFIVLADKFAVVMPNSEAGATPKIPFVVGSINGQTVVGIDGALVVDGSIAARSIDTRGLTIRAADGTVLFGGGTAMNVSLISGLGSVAVMNSIDWTVIGNKPAFGGFAYLDAITAANIGTYIQSAAIGSAYIQDLSVTSAKIAELTVGTTKITGNAVTDVIHNVTTSYGFGSGLWSPFSVVLPEAAVITIFCGEASSGGIVGGNPGGYSGAFCEVLAAGQDPNTTTPLMSVPAGSAPVTRYLAAGSYTFWVNQANGGDYSVLSVESTLVKTKK